jgi:transposase-like zinc ribbon protein
MANNTSGISLIAVYKTFGTTESCLAYLEATRWPEGVRCLVCGSKKVSKFVTNETTREITDEHGAVVKTARVPARHLYQCNEETCRFQFSATAGTIFDKSHLPLPVWFQAVALIVNAKKSVSAKQMQRDLGVNYRTAWHLKHRIREAMQSEGGLFSGTVEMDATYVGGKYDRRRSAPTTTRRRPSPACFSAALKTCRQARALPIPTEIKPVVLAFARHQS